MDSAVLAAGRNTKSQHQAWLCPGRGRQVKEMGNLGKAAHRKGVRCEGLGTCAYSRDRSRTGTGLGWGTMTTVWVLNWGGRGSSGGGEHPFCPPSGAHQKEGPLPSPPKVRQQIYLFCSQTGSPERHP